MLNLEASASDGSVMDDVASRVDYLAGVRALTDMSQPRRNRLATKFAAASPFPHVVLPEVLGEADLRLVEDFPALDWPGWHRFTDGYQTQKATFDDLDRMPGSLRDLLWALNGPAFLGFLEEITGIPSLVPDLHLKGGGLHCSGPGGVLAPHSDFHEYPRLRLFRRVNVIVYLNPGWQDDWGGALELYSDAEATDLVRRVPASFGTMVIFRTDLDSVHGFQRPVPPAQVRRSVATYYYTAAEAIEYGGDTTTRWRVHDAASRSERWQLAAYRGLLRASAGMSYAAHAFNPSLRRAAIRARRERS